MDKINILGFTGSTQSKSTALSILEFIRREYSQKFDLRIFNELSQLPLFNPELENELLKQVA